MRWRDALHPVTMSRIALLAPDFALREVLVEVADEGTVAVDETSTEASRPRRPGIGPGPTAQLQLAGTEPALSRACPTWRPANQPVGSTW